MFLRIKLQVNHHALCMLTIMFIITVRYSCELVTSFLQAVPNRQQKEKRRLLDVTDELFVTLLRLRRGLEMEFLADLMAVSTSLISRIVTTWFHLLGRELSFLVQWPTKQQVQSNLPRAFRFFPKTRVIIDCTEFQLQRPSLPSVQRKTYSSYKHCQMSYWHYTEGHDFFCFRFMDGLFPTRK